MVHPALEVNREVYDAIKKVNNKYDWQRVIPKIEFISIPILL